MTVPAEDELSVVLSNSITSADYSPISTHIYYSMSYHTDDSRYDSPLHIHHHEYLASRDRSGGLQQPKARLR